jgi:hypothetical protein
MAPTPLNPTSRYVPEGTRKVYLMTACSNYLSPTRAELNAGKDLTAEIAEMTGFTTASDQKEVPDLSGRFTGKIPGRITAADSAIKFYADATGNDVRSVLPRDTAGWVVCLWEGDVPGQKMDVFPIKVATQAKQPSIEDPEQIEIQMTITKVPAENVTIPA